MNRPNVPRFRCTWLALIVGLVGLAVPATADYSGPIAGYDMGYFWDVKSPELSDSDVFSTTWAMRVTTTHTNYAGFLFDLQYDGHELVSLNVIPQSIHEKIEVPGATGLYDSWEFSGSQSTSQAVAPVVVWISPSQAMNSGTLVSSGTLLPLFKFSGLAKNTTTLNNSDIDITISAWRIFHAIWAGEYHLQAGDWVYQTTGGDWANQPGTGSWIQLTTPTIFPDVPISAFLAMWSVDNVAGYGIEHVPEPISVSLLLAGTGALAIGRRRRT